MSQQNPTVEEANAYAVEFIKNGKKGKSFRAAFPKSACSDGTADTKGCKLFKTSQIQTRISQIQAASNQQTEEEFCVSVSDIKKGLLEVVKKGMQNKTDAMGNVIANNLPAIVSAFSELNKMDGNHATNKIDLTSSDGSMTPKDFNGFYDEEG